MPRRRKQKKDRLFKKGVKASLNVAKEILYTLSDLVELLPDPLEGPYGYTRRLSGWVEELPRYRLRQEIKRMKDRGWINEAEKNGKKFLKLTKKGRICVLCHKIKALPLPNKSAWDGKWRLAVFDIPEKGKLERNAIRRTLKAAGFFQMQKSVYLYPYQITCELSEYLHESGLERYVRFAEVSWLEGDKEFRKKFEI